jgi:hypothetical protein
VLDLVDNPVTKLAGYRHRLFELFSELEILDRRDIDGNEVPN